MASSKAPLVIILDSLDQLHPENGARLLKWLPGSLPPYCRIVVSTLPDDKYKFFSVLKVNTCNFGIEFEYPNSLGVE